MLDGPLHGIRHRRDLPVIGYPPPPHARPRTLGQSAGADGRGTVGPLRDGRCGRGGGAGGWLPGFASALHRDARAPVNLTPIAGLERHLHRLQGDARLALRAVREAVLERKREGTDGMIDDEGTHRPASTGRWARAGGPTATRVPTPPLTLCSRIMGSRSSM